MDKNVNRDISNKELFELIKRAQDKEEPVIVLTGTEIEDLRKLLQNKEVLQQLAEDRKAFGRVFTWVLYAIVSIATLFTGWSTIGDYFSKMFKGS